MYKEVKYMPVGDCALLVEFGNTIDLIINQKVHALNYLLSQVNINGVEECIPTYRSLLVRYNPLKTSYEKLVFQIKNMEKKLDAFNLRKEIQVLEVPTVYGGEYGPDLCFVAEYHNLSEDDVIRIHSQREYRVYMIGFIAGFPYLGEVAEEIATPRLETPRIKVPKGSVGIAGKQTGIYPREAPGGWRIIGRTPLQLFNPYKTKPTLLEPGDKVKFKPITEKEFHAYLSAKRELI
jgi:KipI family sensor histidine kinase inhibitor